MTAVVFDYTLQDHKTPSAVCLVNEVAEQVLNSHEMVRFQKLKIEPGNNMIVAKIMLNFNEEVVSLQRTTKKCTQF